MQGYSRHILLSFSLLLTACAVGPDFKPPEAPAVQAYTPHPLLLEKTIPASNAANDPPYFVVAQDLPADWWGLFQSKSLNKLIEDAFKKNPSIAAAKAALRQAQENSKAYFGAQFFPGLDLGLNAMRERVSQAGVGNFDAPKNIFGLYTASAKLGYSLDLFGGSRRGLESLNAQVEYQKFLLETSCLALSANIVSAAIAEASLRAQINATTIMIRLNEEALNIVKKQAKLGSASQIDVLSQEAQLASTRATLPVLKKNLAQNSNALAVLAGVAPSEHKLSAFSFDDLHLPKALPLSLPSSLVRQRPDIRAYEALLHQASAGIGVAIANRFPVLNLSASYNLNAKNIASLFNSGGDAWSLGSEILQPIFHGNSLIAKQKVAVAAYDEAYAQYQQTVLEAFQNVADVLSALAFDSKSLSAYKEAFNASRDLLKITRKQHKLGAVNYFALLNAERQYQLARIEILKAKALSYTNTAALFQALGGGWWNRETNN